MTAMHAIMHKQLLHVNFKAHLCCMCVCFTWRTAFRAEALMITQLITSAVGADKGSERLWRSAAWGSVCCIGGSATAFVCPPDLVPTFDGESVRTVSKCLPLGRLSSHLLSKRKKFSVLFEPWPRAAIISIPQSALIARTGGASECVVL